MKNIELPGEKQLNSEIMEAIDLVVERGDFVMGKEMYAFEEATCEYLGVKHAFGLNSGTDAVVIALAAAGIGEGDEVITSPFCFVSNAEAIALSGAKPVFADIDPLTFNLSPDSVRSAITPATRAVLPIHMYGLSADMDAINGICAERGLTVIEDACQAYGAEAGGRRIGSESEFAAFSFFHTKPLGAWGDAGMLTTCSDETAEKIRLLRNHGSRRRYYHDEIGYSSRLDTLQAAVLLVQLKYFEAKLEAIRAHADRLNRELSGVGDLTLPVETEGCSHIYNLYTFRTGRRDELIERLQSKGIRCSIAFPLSIHLQKAFGYLGYSRGDFPESERAQDEIISLTINPYWTDEQFSETVFEIGDFFS